MSKTRPRLSAFRDRFSPPYHRKLRDALAALEAEDTATACELLGALIHEVNARTDKKIAAPDAVILIGAANLARELLGCV